MHHATSCVLLAADVVVHAYHNMMEGARIAQWLERRTRDQKVLGLSPGRSGGRFFFSGVNFLCWLLFRYPFHSGIAAVARKRNPGHFAKSAGGRLQLNTHTHTRWVYVCLAVTCHRHFWQNDRDLLCAAWDSDTVN